MQRVAAALIERLEKVATPLTALTVNVPESVPEPLLVPMAIVIDAVDVVMTVPDASSTETTTEGAIAEPCVPLEGWVVKTSWVAPDDVGEKIELVAEVRPFALAARV